MQVDLMGAIQEAKRRAQETASGDSGLISADDLNRILNLARASAGELPSIGVGHEMTPEESSWIKPQRPSYIGTRMERTLPEASWLDYITSGTANLFTRGAEEAKMWQNEYEEAAKSAQERAPTPAEQQEIEMNAPDLLNLPENERAAAWHKRLAKAQEFRGERDMRAANKIKPTEFRRPESGLQSIAAEVLQNVPYSLKNMPSNALATMTMGVPGAFLGGALSAFGEGRDESTDVYWDLRAKGVPHKEAFDRAMRHMGWTTGGLMLSDPIENMATFGLGKLFPNMSPFARTIVGAGVNMAGEGAEEGLEEVGAALSKGEPIDWGNVGHASGIGAISGGIMGAAGNVLSNIANAYNNALKPDLNDVTSQVAEALYRENEVDRLENEYLDWYRDWGEPIEQRDAARADDYNEEDLADANRQVEEFMAGQDEQRKVQEQAKREQEAADRELEAEDYLAKLERDLTRQQQINQEYDLNALDDFYTEEYENEVENLQRTNNNIVQSQRINQNQADINAQNREYNANKRARQAESEQQARENARLERERENNANYNNSLAGIIGGLTARNGEPNGVQKSNAYGNNVFNELNNTVNNLEARNNRLNGDINILDNVKRELENLRDRIRSGLEDGKSYKIRERIRNLINTLKAVRQQRKEQEQARQAQDQARQAQDTEDYYAKLDRDLSRQQQLENEYDLNALDDYYAEEYEAEALERQREIKRKITQNDREEHARRVENEAIREARTAQDKENAEFDSLVREADEQYIDPNSEFGQLLNEGDRQLEAAKDFKEARFGVKLSTLPEGEREKEGAARRRIAERRRQSPEYKRFEQNVKKFLAKRQAAREEEEFNSLLHELDEAEKTAADNTGSKGSKKGKTLDEHLDNVIQTINNMQARDKQQRERATQPETQRENQLTIDQNKSNAQEQDVTSAALESAKAEQEPELATAVAEEPEKREEAKTESKPVNEAALEEAKKKTRRRGRGRK